MILASKYTSKDKTQLVAIFIIILILPLVILLPNNPYHYPIPNRDSGVFLYIGQQWLKGYIPYRDVWDHKPPMIFMINAFGLLVGQGTRWGLWVLELFFLCLSAGLGYIGLNRSLGRLPAIFGSVTWLITLAVLWEGGNFTEEYALLFQFLAILLFFIAETNNRNVWYFFLIGVTGAISFLLRQNLIGIWLAIYIYLLFERFITRELKRLVADFFYILIGTLSVIGIIVLYFSAFGALDDFLDATIKYNLIYSTNGMTNRLQSIMIGLIKTSFSGAGIIVSITWVLGLLLLLTGKSEKLEIGGAKRALLTISIIALPIEILLTSLSGRSYPHYYIAWLPAYALLSGYFVLLWPAMITKKRANKFGIISILTIMCVFPVVVLSMKLITSIRQTGFLEDEKIVEYIRNNSGVDDYVLMWGAETAYNFVSNRQSPTRYVYQYPLFTSGYQNPNMIQEFLTDLEEKKPLLIIDTSSTNQNVPSLINNQLNSDLSILIDYLNSAYSIQDFVLPNKWVVYKFIGN